MGGDSEAVRRQPQLRQSVGFHSQAVKSGDGNCFLAYEGDTPEVWNVQLESFFIRCHSRK